MLKSNFGKIKIQWQKGNFFKRQAISVSLFLVVMFSFSSNFAASISWSGGSLTSGEYLWSDASNWSTNTVPTSVDDVFFPSTANYSAPIVIKSEARSRDIIWDDFSNYSGTPVIKFLNNSLKISGSILFPDPADFEMIYDYNFIISLEGGTVSPRTINTNNQVIKCKALNFDDINGDWTLTGDLSTLHAVSLIQGSLHLNGKTLSSDFFFSENTKIRTLDISNSLMLINGYNIGFAIKKTNLNFIVTNSTIEFSPEAGSIILKTDGTTGSRVEFDKVYCNKSKLTINGFNKFNEFKTNDYTYFPIDQEILDLRLEAGAKLVLQPSYVNKVKNLYAYGSCSNPIIIESNWSGKNAIIQTFASGDDYFLDNVFIESVALDVSNGTPSFGVNNTHYDLTGGNQWSAASSNNNGTTFTWVGNGNDDNWNNPDNWYVNVNSTLCIPSPIDNVEFLASSFSAQNQSVILTNSNGYCKNMYWNSVPNGTNLVSTNPSYETNQLNIYGSIELSSNMGILNSSINTLSFNGDLNFKSNSLGNIINTNGIELQSNIYFNGGGGSWILSSDITTSKDIYLSGGLFNSNSKEVNASVFYSVTRNSRGIEMGSSTFNVTRWFFSSNSDEFGNTAGNINVPDPNLYFNSGTSLIEIKGNSGATANVAIMGYGLTYYNINVDVNPSSLSIEPVIGLTGCTVNQLKLQNSIKILNYLPCLISNSIEFFLNKRYTLTGTIEIEALADLKAIGNCDGMIAIKGGNFIKTTGAPIVVDYCIIENNTVTPTMFTANNSLRINSNTWNQGTIPIARTLHFKASTTNALWSEPSNWYDTYSNDIFSNSSGATSCIPGPFDDVVFHDNSFDQLQTPRLEILTDNAYCRNMTWEDPNLQQYPFPEVKGTSTNGQSNNQTLNIYGSLTLPDVNQINWTYPATTNFRSHNNSPINRTLKTNGHELKDNVNIDLNSGNTLTLISDLRVKPAVYVGTISLNSGTFDISSKEMTAYIFESSSSNEPRSLIADGATINCIQAFAPTLSHIPANNLNIIFDQTTIKLGNWNIGELLNGGGLSSNNINYTGAEIYFNSLDFIVGVINGTDNIFEKVEFKKGGTIKGDNSFKNLIFNEGNTYLLEAGKTQIIKAGGSFQASGVSGQPISIESSSDGNLAFLNSEEPICLDYIEMRDIKGTYVAPNPILTHALVAGENSVNGSNNEGWAFTNCIPDTIFSCVGEEILFNQIPSPCLTSWNFGDNTTIIAQNPTHTYNNSGSYYVKVSFNTPCGLIGHDPVDEPSTDSRNYIVVVKPSCCDTLDFPGYRTVEGIISSDEVWGDKIYVTGNIQVRYGAKLDITNADVIFSNGARIGVAENSSLVATNSTFRPCDVNETWTDIVFIQNSTGKLNNNIFINAKSGINIQTSNSVDIIGNQFTNFFNAIIINPGQTNSNLDHLITNNDFTINRDFVNIKNIPSNIYGIKVNGINLKPSISLNEFHYSYLSEDLIRSYGIHITNSTTNASDNKFVNLLYPYYQSNNSGISSFENNEINYNNSFNSDYFSTSLVAGITIENCHNLSTITNNTVISSDVLDQSYGIYVNNATNTLISDNSIKKFYDGILLSGVQQSQINNNNLEQSLSRGVIVVDCFNNVAISSNIITNIPNGFQGIGIMYITNIVGTSATVSIEGNCILNTSMPIDLTNSTTNCLQLPSIHNNYLYNYSSIGVRSSQFSGNIGSSSSHGKNSFVSNTNAFDFYNLTTSCTVNLQGNWPIEVKTDNGLIHQVVVDNSTSSCGRQVKQLRRIGSEGEAHLNFTYGLTFSNANSNYSSGTFELLNTFEDSEIVKHSEVILNTLLLNEDNSNAKRFIVELFSKFNFTTQETAWLSYQIAKHNADWTESKKQLLLVQGLNSLDNGEFEVEQLRVNTYSTGRTLLDLNDAEILDLINLYATTLNIEARSILHSLQGDKPYIYKIIELSDDFAIGDYKTENLLDDIILYPNPSSGLININLKSFLLLNSELTIIDMYGKTVFGSTLQAFQNKYSLNLDNLGSGAYHMIIENENTKLNSRFQIVK